ncbi:MAG TPA: hypothetical protein VMB27_22925 [Solirubrobacteraceae bacterium]|nr:hypothetical protein [Solirubrobacteraceae bacterium]
MRTAFSRPRPRRFGALLALLLIAAVASIAVNGLASANTGSGGVARLVLKRQDPATVGGTGFKPDARVRVTFAGAGKFVRRPMTNSRGAFTATFPTFTDRCSAWMVTASQPGRAPVVLRGAARPECTPMSTQ